MGQLGSWAVPGWPLCKGPVGRPSTNWVSLTSNQDPKRPQSSAPVSPIPPGWSSPRAGRCPFPSPSLLPPSSPAPPSQRSQLASLKPPGPLSFPLFQAYWLGNLERSAPQLDTCSEVSTLPGLQRWEKASHRESRQFWKLPTEGGGLLLAECPCIPRKLLLHKMQAPLLLGGWVPLLDLYSLGIRTRKC